MRGEISPWDGTPAPVLLGPTLLNGWQNYDDGSVFELAGYYKDATNRVWLEGLLKNGAGVMFTLPVGFRPRRTKLYTVVGGSAFAEVRVAPTGNVSLQTGSNAYVSLDGISFMARIG